MPDSGEATPHADKQEGEIVKRKTADDESAQDEGTAGEPNKRPSRGRNRVDKFTCNISVMLMGLGIIILHVGLMMHKTHIANGLAISCMMCKMFINNRKS